MPSTLLPTASPPEGADAAASGAWRWWLALGSRLFGPPGSLFPAWQTISVVRRTDGEVANFISVFSDISAL